MSKYDQLNYISHYENINKTYPECVKEHSKIIEIIPDELLEAVTVEEFKKCLKLETDEDKRNFKFFNNNQSVINKDYFRNAKYFNDNMNQEEKKDFLIDYLIFYFSDKVDGEYFENNLKDIFNLNGKNYDKNDFDFMIKNHFKKNEIDLNNDEDRNEFKNIIEDDIKIVEENNNINNIKVNDEDDKFEINTKL